MTGDARLKSISKLVRDGGGRWRNIKNVAQLLKPYRLQVAATLIAMLVVIGTGLAPPYLAKLAVDNGILAKNLNALTVVAIAFIASAVLYWLAYSLQTYLVGWVGQRVLAGLRIKIFEHLESLSLGFYSRSSTGVLVSRITNDVQALDQLVSDGLVTLLSSTLTLIGVATVLLLLDFKLALITFTVLPVLGASSIVFRYFSIRAYRLVRDRIATITSYLQESLSGIRVVRAYSREPHHISEFARHNDAYRQVNMRTVRLNAAYYPNVELMSAAGTVVILLYGGYQAISGKIEIGVVVAFIGYLQSFFDPIQQLSQLYNTYQQGMAALDKIFELLGQEPDLVDAADAHVLPEIKGSIKFESVWFSYEEDRWALRGIDLEIDPGETVALVGHTGAGKSTMMKLVSRFYDPQKGRVLVDGHDLRSVTANSLRTQLGTVPQEGYLFSGTVAENIRFGRPDASIDEIKKVAHALGADEAIERLPQDYETEVGERGAGISAGQRQLIAFTRALLASPRILLLDEATSSVDAQLESQIINSLGRLLKGRTSLIIAHRLSTVRRADRVVVLDRGVIAETGSHEELLKKQGTYFDLYSSWHRREREVPSE